MFSFILLQHLLYFIAHETTPLAVSHCLKLFFRDAEPCGTARIPTGRAVHIVLALAVCSRLQLAIA